MRRLLLNTAKNDFIILAAGFLTVIIISISFGKEGDSGPSQEKLLKNPSIKSIQVIEDLGLTVVEFKTGLTCVVPFNKKSISCNPKSAFVPFK